MRELRIARDDAGQRLDRFLPKAVPLLPTSLLQKYLRLGRMKVNGRPAKRDTRLAEGDVLTLYVSDEFFEPIREENAFRKIGTPRVEVVYEDENLLLADKPAGVLCHSAEPADIHTLITNIQAYLYRSGEWDPSAAHAFAPALCNRIDRNTRGLVIAAKNSEALRILNERIRSRELDKLYLCAVHGRPAPPAGTLTGYLFKDAKKNQVFVSERMKPGAKSAEMQYRTLATRGGLSLVECLLLTGRTHQIRAQLAHTGTPLLGDGKYGSERQNKPFGEKSQALCSYKLRFSFQGDAGPLEYLRGREFRVNDVDFVRKYFPSHEI